MFRAPRSRAGRNGQEDGYSQFLTFPDRVKQVRNDQIHLSDLGASIAGYVIAAAIAP